MLKVRVNDIAVSRTMNNKGIVDEYRRRKLAYDVVKRIYHAYEDKGQEDQQGKTAFSKQGFSLLFI